MVVGVRNKAKSPPPGSEEISVFQIEESQIFFDMTPKLLEKRAFADVSGNP